MTVSIGSLRHRLKLERIDATPAGGGAQDMVWVEVETLSANIRPVAGRETTQSDSFSGNVSHAITIRYRDNVVPEMRFRQDNRIFSIRSVIDLDERRRWLVCQCDEQRL